MDEINEIIDNLFHLMSGQKLQNRQELLHATVAKDIEFYGWQTRTSGIDEFDHNFQSPPIEISFVRTTPVDRQGDWLRFGWEARLPDGSILGAAEGNPYAGLQVSQLSAGGRIRSIIPFRGQDIPT